MSTAPIPKFGAMTTPTLGAALSHVATARGGRVEARRTDHDVLALTDAGLDIAHHRARRREVDHDLRTGGGEVVNRVADVERADEL